MKNNVDSFLRFGRGNPKGILEGEKGANFLKGSRTPEDLEPFNCLPFILTISDTCCNPHKVHRLAETKIVITGEFDTMLLQVLKKLAQTRMSAVVTEARFN